MRPRAHALKEMPAASSVEAAASKEIRRERESSVCSRKRPMPFIRTRTNEGEFISQGKFHLHLHMIG